MKKILLTFVLFLPLSCLAYNFGSYKPETEYGLIDGFKFNFFNREEGTPLVQLRSETKEEQQRIEREKNKPKEEQDDVQLFKFMLEDTIPF